MSPPALHAVCRQFDVTWPILFLHLLCRIYTSGHDPAKVEPCDFGPCWVYWETAELGKKDIWSFEWRHTEFSIEDWNSKVATIHRSGCQYPYGWLDHYVCMWCACVATLGIEFWGHLPASAGVSYVVFWRNLGGARHSAKNCHVAAAVHVYTALYLWLVALKTETAFPGMSPRELCAPKIKICLWFLALRISGYPLPPLAGNSTTEFPILIQ